MTAGELMGGDALLREVGCREMRRCFSEGESEVEFGADLRPVAVVSGDRSECLT